MKRADKNLSDKVKMPVFRVGPRSPVLDYFKDAVRATSIWLRITPFLQGHLTDLSFRARDGRSVECHKIVAAALSPFVAQALEGSPDCDQVILPDFGLAEIYGMMNFY